jgi:hypothetical protein
MAFWADDVLPKRCSRCGIDKTFADFHGDSSTPTGRSYWCKACKSAYAKDWYARVGRKQRRELRDFRKRFAQRLEHVRLEQGQRAG